MSYTPPITFVNGTGLAAISLQQNEQALRDYLNADIVEADIQTSTFSTSDLQEGEAFGVTNDFIFMTGDQYSYYQADHSSFQADRLYHTSTVKRYEPMTNVRWQSIPSLSKQFYMEDAGSALIEIGFFAYEDENDDCRGGVFPWTTGAVPGASRSNGQDSQYILAVDGDTTTPANATKNYSFAESGGTTIAFGEHSVMLGEQDYQGNAVGQRKYITIMYLAKNLSQGWHQVSVLVNACNEKGFVSSRNLNIECFYDMGYNEVSPASIATNRKLPETIF